MDCRLQMISKAPPFTNCEPPRKKITLGMARMMHYKIGWISKIRGHSPSTVGDTTYAQWQPMIQYIYHRSKLWIIALLSQYSIISQVFSWAAAFSNTANIRVENEDSCEGGRLAYF